MSALTESKLFQKPRTSPKEPRCYRAFLSSTRLSGSSYALIELDDVVDASAILGPSPSASVRIHRLSSTRQGPQNRGHIVCVALGAQYPS